MTCSQRSSSQHSVSSQATKRERLKSYATVLGLIRDATPEDCKLILEDLRALRTLIEAIKVVQRNWVCQSGD
jgi:hypothetical protein